MRLSPALTLPFGLHFPVSRGMDRAVKGRVLVADGEDLASWVASVARDQDRDAFARLYRHFAPRLLAWMTRAGLSPAEAEDIAQDCLVAIWRKAPLYNPSQAGVSTWVFAIARNLRIDRARKSGRRETLPLGDWDEIDESPSSEARLIANQDQSRVREALAQLPVEQKQVLMEAYFSDKPQSEIARDLNLPLGTVKSRLRLALAKLRTRLEGEP